MGNRKGRAFIAALGTLVDIYGESEPPRHIEVTPLEKLIGHKRPPSKLNFSRVFRESLEAVGDDLRFSISEYKKRA